MSQRAPKPGQLAPVFYLRSQLPNLWAAIAVLGLCLAVTAVARAAPIYALSWHLFGAGGGRSAGGGLTLEGSIGQPFTGRSATSGYDLRAGFWQVAAAEPPSPTATPSTLRLYLPVIVRD
jgi:hypothetical protein